MAQPYVGEIRMFAGSFAPVGWMFCEGQTLAIADYDTLYNLIGTTYGGDGQTTFALPDLRGRIPVHAGTGVGSGYVQAQAAGAESVTLTTPQIASHAHSLLASTSLASATTIGGNVIASPSALDLYRPQTAPNTSMATAAISVTGGGQPHENRMPTLCVSFIISLFGIYPIPA